MAPPPEYDKEPKAPDKSATNIPSEDSKALYNLVNEHQTNSDTKSTNSSANTEVENNKHVETLDDGQLRALLDEAITYKCPKDREGKSSLFKELLEEVEQDEQDEQACEAAARLPGGRARRGGPRGRRPLPHSNSLQDLVAALAAEPAPRRARHNHPPAPVSARAHHGGSLPSGVDTSFLLSEEPMRGAVGAVGAVGAGSSGGAEYVATVRCVNPSPLAERRVSASDAHCPDTDTLSRRSKPVFPMYTARATLEIGSGSVCSGRAVTTTTASNQVRTPPRDPPGARDEGKRRAPRGPQDQARRHRPAPADGDPKERSFWDDGACVDKWYRGLEAYGSPLDRISHAILAGDEHFYDRNVDSFSLPDANRINSPIRSPLESLSKTSSINTARLNLVFKSSDKNIPVAVNRRAFEATKYSATDVDRDYKRKMLDVKDVEAAMARKAYRERVGKDLVAPSLVSYNPTNVRNMSIGPSSPVKVNTDKRNRNPGTSEARDKPAKDKHNHNTRNSNASVNFVTDKSKTAKPADKHKPDNRSRINRYNATQIRSSSPRNLIHSNVNPHPSSQTKIEHHESEVKENRSAETKPENLSDIVTVITKEQSQSDELKPIEASDLIEMTITKEKSQNDETNPEKASDLIETTITKEKSQNDETNPEKASDLIETTITKEKSQNDETNPEKASDLIEMTITKEKSQNDETNPEKASDLFEIRTKQIPQNDTELVDMDNFEEKPRIDQSETNYDTKLVEMISLPSTSGTERSSEFSLFMANQHRLLKAIESNNYKEDKLTNELSSRDTETLEIYTDLSEDQEIPTAKGQTENPFLLTVEKALDHSEDTYSETQGTEMVEMKRVADLKSDTQRAELGSASYFLTLYKRLLTSPCNIDNTVDIKPAGDSKPVLASLDSDTATKPLKKKKDKITARLSRKPHSENPTKKKDIIRIALKKLFFDNITQSDSPNTKLAGAAAAATKEVDSAIPFSCITTPEVVASCTTTASAQAAVPVDPKPLQLHSSYRAVASLTGACNVRAASARAPPASQPELPKPARSMVSSTFNGVPLPRAGPAFSAAAAVAQAAAEEFKKSLDENGNSVQGFSSPQSGSSQQKKQRRKKSSKNETVIKSHQIDGYQGNKDLNEVLRFIESNEPERPKRHDDKKKRSAERRKDKAPRASSLDDLSRAAPQPARPARPALPAPKPERRSWGDERPPFYFRDPNPEPDPEPTDFQTVTKKRKPRRRTDEPEPRGQRPRAPSPRSPPSPRARSERSNDSNDDLDSVHSLPALPSRPAPASYADIARAKHNIPDLIESCNYYGEEPPPPAADLPGYPALEPRPARRRDPDPPPARRPDVVTDRRPPVILLDSAGRGRDLEGVTFGFDVNEQLLGGARREVAVRAGCAALRYVPPQPPPDGHHLHQIVDYVGAAWEDVVRCGGGKVRYFSE